MYQPMNTRWSHIFCLFHPGMVIQPSIKYFDLSTNCIQLPHPPNIQHPHGWSQICGLFLANRAFWGVFNISGRDCCTLSHCPLHGLYSVSSHWFFKCETYVRFRLVMDFGSQEPAADTSQQIPH